MACSGLLTTGGRIRGVFIFVCQPPTCQISFILQKAAFGIVLISTSSSNTNAKCQCQEEQQSQKHYRINYSSTRTSGGSSFVVWCLGRHVDSNPCFLIVIILVYISVPPLAFTNGLNERHARVRSIVHGWMAID